MDFPFAGLDVFRRAAIRDIDVDGGGSDLARRD
jgi:hypothetical protein